MLEYCATSNSRLVLPENMVQDPISLRGTDWLSVGSVLSSHFGLLYRSQNGSPRDPRRLAALPAKITCQSTASPKYQCVIYNAMPNFSKISHGKGRLPMLYKVHRKSTESFLKPPISSLHVSRVLFVYPLKQFMFEEAVLLCTTICLGHRNIQHFFVSFMLFPVVTRCALVHLE